MNYVLLYIVLGCASALGRYATVALIAWRFPEVRSRGRQLSVGLFFACMLLWPIDLIVDSARVLLGIGRVLSAWRTARKLRSET